MISHLSELINPQTASVGKDVEKGEPFCTVGGNADWYSHGGKQCGWRYLKKLKMDLTFNSAIPLLGIYPKDPKMLI